MKIARILPILLLVAVVAFSFSNNDLVTLKSDELYLDELSDSGYEYATFSAG